MTKARALADFIGSGDLSEGSLVGIQTEISNIVDAAPETLNTLNELAAALGDDENFSTTVTNTLATKAPLSNPTFTGTVTATSFTGDGSQLTGVEGVNAAALIKYGAM